MKRAGAASPPPGLQSCPVPTRKPGASSLPGGAADTSASQCSGAFLATAQGLYILLTGIWPLVHYRSFEAVTGPKADPWLVKCVGGLGATLGYAQLSSGSTPAGRAVARRIGIGTAVTFGSIGAIYGGRGRVRRIYLAEAGLEVLWLLAWRADAKARRRARAAPA